MKKMKIIEKKLTEEQCVVKEMLIKEKFNPIYAHILALRKVKTLEEAIYKYKLIPPKNLKGIQNLSEKLADNILKEKKITIVADYDCDGATSCAIAYKGLKMLNCKNLQFIVPNRFKHGYGLSKSIIDDLIKEQGKPDCIITVDNGIAAHEGIDYANSLNIEVLVTDHHLPAKDKENPNCAALVNPNQKGDTSGLNNMAGCGVIFYVLIETLERLKEKNIYNNENPAPNMLNLIDLVSLGTVADVVKLDKNNRLLVKYGLQLLHKGKARQGLYSLFNISQKNIYYANSRDYGFSIAPRINAAGRLEDMTTGIKCLLTEDYDSGKSLATQLNEWNIKRKDIEKDMREVAYDIIENEEQNNKMTRVIYNEEYHEGVIGIVAGRIKEKENVPVIVFSPTEDEEIIKGSGRSIPEVHLRDAIDLVFKQDESMFKGFGGHAMAAGLSIYKNKLEKFKELFEKAVIDMIGDEPIAKEIHIDYILKPEDITLPLAKTLEFEIWGQGFLEPTFKSSFKIEEFEILNNRDTGIPQHTKFIFSDGKGGQIKAIFFFYINEYKIGDEIDVVFKINVSRFKEEEINLLISNILE